VDDETLEPIDAEELTRIVLQYKEIIQFCIDRESGLVTVTLQEYQHLAPIVHHTWHIYIAMRKKKRD
jgi:hypothetical protein